MENIPKLIVSLKEKLLVDLPIFIKVDTKEQFVLGEKIDSYCSVALEQLVGKTEVLTQILLARLQAIQLLKRLMLSLADFSQLTKKREFLDL